MSEMKLCQGPKCHEYKTKDRIRGHKGDKHYETRKRSHMYYNGNFCSLCCQDDWFRKFGTRAIDHFGRIHEPKRTIPYSGESAYLTYTDTKIHDKIKQDEKDENYEDMQKGLDKFSRLNVKAYMTLLD